MCAFMLSFVNMYNNKNASNISKKNFDIIKNINIDEINKNTDFEQKVVNIDGNDYMGIIEIPSLNLQLPVANTWSYKIMKKSPCRYSGSIENDNLVISAHSYKSQFGNIGNLSYGDTLILTDINSNTYIYEVAVVEVLSPTDVDEMINSDFDLTLYTCTKDSKNRITVRLNRV